MNIEINNKQIEDLVRDTVNKKITEKVNQAFNGAYSKKDYIEGTIQVIISNKIESLLETELDNMIYKAIESIDKKTLANNIKTEFVEGLLDKLTERNW